PCCRPHPLNSTLPPLPLPGSRTHSLCHSYLKVSEPSQGLPQFLFLLHLDDQPIARYDDRTSRMEPLVPWMGAEEATTLMDLERIFRTDLEWLSKLSHQTGENPRNCVVAVSAEPPVGKVTLKVVDEKLEVLTCQAFGFYPKEIQAIWMRDGEVCKYETLLRNVAPNSDGTYYISLSIEIDPKERDRVRCHLEHEGLQEPLDLAFKKETGERLKSYKMSPLGQIRLSKVVHQCWVVLGCVI
uniref:Ig-like domain-containing protein n=1 Tax=Naja naja TaxID=35670 RepID=A0A8C6VEF4_NAJNA